MIGRVVLDSGGMYVLYTRFQYRGDRQRLPYLRRTVSKPVNFSTHNLTSVRYTASAQLVPKAYRARVRIFIARFGDIIMKPYLLLGWMVSRMAEHSRYVTSSTPREMNAESRQVKLPVFPQQNSVLRT